MTRYYNLKVYYKSDIDTGFTCDHYDIITENILNSLKKEYETAYNNGYYVALRFEYDIVQ